MSFIFLSVVATTTTTPEKSGSSVVNTDGTVVQRTNPVCGVNMKRCDDGRCRPFDELCGVSIDWVHWYFFVIFALFLCIMVGICYFIYKADRTRRDFRENGRSSARGAGQTQDPPPNYDEVRNNSKKYPQVRAFSIRPNIRMSRFGTRKNADQEEDRLPSWPSFMRRREAETTQAVPMTQLAEGVGATIEESPSDTIPTISSTVTDFAIPMSPTESTMLTISPFVEQVRLEAHMLPQMTSSPNDSDSANNQPEVSQADAIERACNEEGSENKTARGDEGLMILV